VELTEAIATLTEYQANKIVEVMEREGEIEHPLPTSAGEILATAQEILTSAQTAERAGVTMPVVMEILKIAEEIAPEEDPLDKENTVDNNVVESPVEMHNDSSESTVAVNTDATLLQSDQEKELSHSDYLADENWTELPNIPRDFSKCGDLALRSLHAICIARLTKVIFELGLEESDYASAQAHYESAYKLAIVNAPESKVTEKRDSAYFDPGAVVWRDKVIKHHDKAIKLRSWEKMLEVATRGLSREWAMRSGERAAS
jgi:hypothetical protein